ncbi:MAG: hypothetical protein DI551_10240 [Micavibrio aeruginosavorus]|uniref:Exonuclease domain-containing protein n=1 Tax=Micavibrio aeruginosavorus TaxID=349221 RepID=A0A2W5PPG0_9BACT|nr:MAG: hypothetical protein DI551_10240 [Micavibrio aeruginosavorus]
MDIRHIVMDFEASALHGGYPIEVGVAFTWQDWKITDEARLIRHDPWLDHGRWCSEAQDVHNLTKEDVRSGGQSIETVCDWLNGMLAGKTVYADHDKDKGWLCQLFDEAGKRPYFELLHVEKYINRASYVNESCLIDFTRGLESGRDIHRAGPDARRIARALAACVVA